MERWLDWQVCIGRDATRRRRFLAERLRVWRLRFI